MGALTDEHLRRIRKVLQRTGGGQWRMFEVHGTWCRLSTPVNGRPELVARHGHRKGSPETRHPLPSVTYEAVVEAVELALCAGVLLG